MLVARLLQRLLTVQQISMTDATAPRNSYCHQKHSVLMLAVSSEGGDTADDTQGSSTVAEWPIAGCRAKQGWSMSWDTVKLTKKNRGFKP